MNERKKIGMGLVGPGFIAPHHIDAVRRLGNVEVVAIAGSSDESAKTKAAQFGVAKAYSNYIDLLNDSSVEVVHNTTPSYLHFPISMAAMQAGKHVVSDKPLALSPAECEMLCETAVKAGVVNAVTFNYRGNPLVQEARDIIARDGIGKPVFIHGHYLQDWMTDSTVYSWRLDPLRGGASSALADIGSHWCDLAEHISNSRITSVIADLTTVVKTRYSGGGSTEAFSVDHPGGGKPVEIHAEDLASVLLRFENGAKGCFTVGQVLPGHKNALQIEFCGRSASLRWNQERQNELWIGRHNEPNAVMAKDPSLMGGNVKKYAHLPAGHQEGWADAFRNVIADIYTWISTGEKPETVCTFADGYRVCLVIDAILRSHKAGGIWQTVQPLTELTSQKDNQPSGDGRSTHFTANETRHS
jgi:predicted dehydrogenase